MVEHRLDTIDPHLLGSRLKVAREQAGLSYGQVRQLLLDRHQFALVQTFPPFIMEVEEGRQRIGAHLLVLLAGVYGVPVSDLVRDPNEPPLDMVTAIDLYRKGELSEGYVARLLGVSRVEVRLLLEQAEQKGEEQG